MDKEKAIVSLYEAMIEYYKKDPKRTQHFIKVHSLAKLIGSLEGMDPDSLFTLESAALVHDIGIKIAEEKYGKCDGKLQEQEGPKVAEEMLRGLDFDEAVIERVSFLVGHHHTYTDITGLDYQILVEADFLVNLYEDQVPSSAVRAALEKIFKTKSGRQICVDMFGLQ